MVERVEKKEKMLHNEHIHQTQTVFKFEMLYQDNMVEGISGSNVIYLIQYIFC